MSLYLKDIRRALAKMIRELELPGIPPEHVYTNRIRPYDVERMPAVCIFTLTETGEVASDAPRAYDCEAEIGIAVYVRTSAQEDTDEDDLLDDYLQEIRNLLGEQDTIDGHATGSEYAGCEWVIGNEGEFAMAGGQLRFKVRYREDQPGPDSLNLANLRHINAKWDAAPKADGTKDAEDDIHYKP